MNYIIEGNTNFYDGLMKALCEDDDENKENLCLISNQPLTPQHITLTCNHSFNYIPLFHEVCKQKKTRNLLETQRLTKKQIKCPYCRNIQNHILPYNEKKIKDRIFGINWPPRLSMGYSKCEALYKSGKKKGQPCNKQCLGKYCKRHSNYKIKTPHLICKAILKSGKNKGKQCTCLIKENGLCGKHKKKHT